MAAATAAGLYVATWKYNPDFSAFSIEYKPEEQLEISRLPDWIIPLHRKIMGWTNKQAEQWTEFTIRNFFKQAFIRYQESNEGGEHDRS